MTLVIYVSMQCDAGHSKLVHTYPCSVYYVKQACVLYKMRSKPAWRGFFGSYVIVKWESGESES